MPEPLITHSGIAAVLMHDNVDTDQIIPSREMKTVSRAGLENSLFAGWRYTEPGGRDPVPDFVLNRPEQAGTTILISGENFGCGSSREHAAWALVQYGIRVIIAKSFGEIFYGNCLRNGILPVVLESGQVDALASVPSAAMVSVDLPNQTVSCDQLRDWQATFEIGAYPKRLLAEGLNPIGLTLTVRDQIEAFFERDAQRRPWVYSAA